MAVMVVVTFLLNVLQIVYASKSAPPLDTHPKTMLIATSTFLLYCFACYLEHHITSIFPSSTWPAPVVIYTDFRIFLGFISMVSFASILFSTPSTALVLVYLLSALFFSGKSVLSLIQNRDSFRMRRSNSYSNLQADHKRFVLGKNADEDCEQGLELVSIPDGLEEGDNRFNLGMLMESMQRVMPPKLEELIDNRRITCVVIYVAFGSFTAFNLTQFQELALGLQLTNKPFLWVARPGITFKETNEGDYPQGYKERIGSRGKIVGWAPQEKVLRHPSVACFLSHCGWNSTVEGVSNGVPFLCWPCFADQYLNESYICDVWKIGLWFEKDESGIIRQGEIKNKIEQLLGDKHYKAMVTGLKEKIVDSVQNGCSYKNLSNVIDWIRDK